MMMRAAALALCAACAHAVSVEQVHTGLGLTEDVLTVSWVTQQNVNGSHVMFGERALSSRAVADTRAFTQDPGRTWYTHVANMTGLRTNTTYRYKVGDDTGYSPEYRVMNRRKRVANDPYRHIILGDLGAACAFSLCTACTQGSEYCNVTTCHANTTVGLVSETETADMFLHVGDFAYDLGTRNGEVGDIFMTNMEQVAANNVYMVSHGNHEDSDINLAHYIERFRSMPSNADPLYFETKNGRAPNSLYFSWDHGLVHYVSISTELFFGVKDKHTNAESFIKWLKEDLKKANTNRDAVPWIIVQGHRSLYCTCDADCLAPAWDLRLRIGGILHSHGVDLFVNGHEHNYERTYPVHDGLSDRSNVNPKATIFVVSGAAGSHEMHEPFTLPQPEWSAYRSNSFSYSRVLVHNYTHLHWQQVQTDPTLFPMADYGRVIDDWWIVTDKHGPFKSMPTYNATGVCRDDLCDSRDHWEPMLNMPRKEGEQFADTIIRFRAEQGEAAWQAKLRTLMENARSSGKAVEWEDVHEDGNSDSAWRNDKHFQWKGTNA
eukprot:TRINITY_DN307_c1_g1_i2.p1 TRINITY_DN307_c1_g1~~TRINITY_DN307_c1_g1_i2.p1  ORF type:complete len:560 (+),score=221.09 TRINITY_DN307_c1_g1_i2:41-1681(+)